MRAKQVLNVLLLAMLAVGTAWAHPAPDLSGRWVIKDAHSRDWHNMDIQADGNAWFGVGRSKTPIVLNLSNLGLAHQWVGDLELWGKHRVKARVKNADLVIIKDLDDEDEWTLTREKSKR